MIPLGVSENHFMVDLILTFWKMCAKVTPQSAYFSSSLETSYMEESRLFLQNDYAPVCSDVMTKNGTERAARYTLGKKKKKKSMHVKQK